MLQRIITTTSDMYIVNKALEAALLAESNTLMTASVKKAIALYMSNMKKDGEGKKGGEAKDDNDMAAGVDPRTLVDLTNKFIEDYHGIPFLMDLIFLSIKAVLPSAAAGAGAGAGAGSAGAGSAAGSAVAESDSGPSNALHTLLEEYYKAGIGQALLNVCKQHSENITTCMSCQRLISIVVSHHEKGRMFIGQEKGCKVLRSLFSKYENKLQACELACGIITNLCRDNVGNQDRLGDVGICNFITNALQAHAFTNDKFCFACLQAVLGMCAKNHTTNRELFYSKELPSVFNELLVKYRSNFKLAEVICKALVLLVSANKSTALAFNKAGLAQLVYDIITNTGGTGGDTDKGCPASLISLCLIVLAFTSHYTYEDQRHLNENIRQLLINLGNQHPNDDVRKNAKFAANLIFSGTR